MRGAQNEASHSGAFSGSFIVVAPFGTKIGTPCIRTCCLKCYFLLFCIKTCEGCSRWGLPQGDILILLGCSDTAWYKNWDTVHRSMLFGILHVWHFRKTAREVLMLIKSSFSAYHLYSKNVALLCLVGIEVTLPSTWRRRPSYKFVLVCCCLGPM